MVHIVKSIKNCIDLQTRFRKSFCVIKCCENVEIVCAIIFFVSRDFIARGCATTCWKALFKGYPLVKKSISEIVRISDFFVVKVVEKREYFDAFYFWKHRKKVPSRSATWRTISDTRGYILTKNQLLKAFPSWVLHNEIFEKKIEKFF